MCINRRARSGRVWFLIHPSAFPVAGVCVFLSISVIVIAVIYLQPWKCFPRVCICYWNQQVQRVSFPPARCDPCGVVESTKAVGATSIHSRALIRCNEIEAAVSQ